MKIKKFVDWFIPIELKQDDNLYSNAKLLVGVTFALIVADLGYSNMYYNLNHMPAVIAILLAGVGLLVPSLFLLKYTGSIKLSGNMIVLALFFILVFLNFSVGNVGSVGTIWYSTIPILSVLLIGVRFGIFWSLASLAVISLLYYLIHTGYQFTELSLSAFDLFMLQYSASAGLVVIILAFTVVFDTIRQSHNRFINNLLKLTQQIAEGNTNIELNTLGSIESGKQLVLQNMIDSLNDKVQLAQEIAKGNLEVEVTLASENDALGEALQKMVWALREKSQLAEQIAQGDLSQQVVLASDKDTLGKSLQRMTENLNDLLTKVVESTHNIKDSSSQISISSQNLSEGSNEQAASLEEISSSMEELEGQAKSNAENASIANQKGLQAKQSAEEGNTSMGKMLEAMREINVTSENVSNIIKTIDEIAFQTNVLAINAAVEAARAGEHGKGFAVVSEEVRNLAQRSAQASKETTKMITDSIRKIEVGAEIADETAQSLASIVEGSSISTNMINNIVTGSNEQSLGISQINQGLSQLNQVVQSNAAIAEQSAAASQELDNEMNQLEQLTKRFKLRHLTDEARFNPQLQYQSAGGSYTQSPRKSIGSGISEKKRGSDKTITFTKSYDDFLST
jgi:methyl-accepting chemotaxis protein